MTMMIDRTGLVYDRLTVVDRAENNRHGQPRWLCLCECGTLKTVTGNSLRSGKTKSCGCLHRTAGTQKVIDLTGLRFGRLIVLRSAGTKAMGKDGKRFYCWDCRCDCGRVKAIVGASLKQGKSNSCGCIHAESIGNRRRTHGESNRNSTTEHRSYMSAKGRCTSKTNGAYDRYGGRGIEFRFDSYESFLACMGRKPTPSHSLDRIDTNGHYEPGNLRWATHAEQANNRRPHIRRKTTTCPHCSETIYGVRPSYIRTGWRDKEATAKPQSASRKSPEASSYYSAKCRCANPKQLGWERYGGRGIKFLFTSFAEFLQHVGPRPTLNHSLDRIDPNGNYELGNVRWATNDEQQANKRPQHKSTIECPHCGGEVNGFRMTNARMKPSATPRPES